MKVLESYAKDGKDVIVLGALFMSFSNNWDLLMYSHLIRVARTASPVCVCRSQPFSTN